MKRMKTGTGNKREHIFLRISSAEKEKMRKRAAKDGMSISDYLREALAAMEAAKA